MVVAGFCWLLVDAGYWLLLVICCCWLLLDVIKLLSVTGCYWLFVVISCWVLLVICCCWLLLVTIYCCQLILYGILDVTGNWWLPDTVFYLLLVVNGYRMFLVIGCYTLPDVNVEVLFWLLVVSGQYLLLSIVIRYLLLLASGFYWLSVVTGYCILTISKCYWLLLVTRHWWLLYI